MVKRGCGRDVFEREYDMDGVGERGVGKKSSLEKFLDEPKF